MPLKDSYFSNLDGLRALAFLSVHLTHCFSANTLFIAKLKEYELANHFVQNGALGVNFFFVLSGFLITYLLLHEEASRGNINISFFYIRRVLRIWPLYYLSVFIGFILIPSVNSLFDRTNEYVEATPILYLSFLSNFDVIKNGFPTLPPLGVLWSVSIEEQFYLVWPILLLLFRNIRPYLFLFIILVSLVFRFLCFRDDNLLYLHTISVINDMAVGGLLAYLSLNSKKFVKVIKNISKGYILFFYCISTLIVFYRQEALIAFNFYPIVDRLIFSVLFGLVIIEQNYADHSFFKLKRSKLLTSWGKLTYGLYCYHLVCIVIADHIFTWFNINDYIVSLLIFKPVISLALTAVVSWFSYYYFEIWFLRIKKSFKKVS